MKNESLTEFPWGVFANSITAEKAKHVCQNFGMEITGLVVTKTKIDGACQQDRNEIDTPDSRNIDHEDR